MSDIRDGRVEGFKFKPPARWVLELTLVHDNGDFTVRGPGGTNRLPADTPTWEDWRGWMADADIEPRAATPPQTGMSWDDLDTLFTEVVMDVSRANSALPRTPEVDAERKRLRREVREMKARDVMPMPLNQ